MLDSKKEKAYHLTIVNNAKALTKRVVRPEKAKRAAGWCEAARVGNDEVHFRAAA